jgi:hypothetical protein
MDFPLTATWTDNEEVQEQPVRDVASALDLFHKVDSAARKGDPTMVEFKNGRGAAIAIGAGRDVTVITAQSSEDPPYFMSLARGSLVPEDPTFMYLAENTPYPVENTVPKAEGVTALERFLRSGELDPALDWERL